MCLYTPLLETTPRWMPRHLLLVLRSRILEYSCTIATCRHEAPKLGETSTIYLCDIDVALRVLELMSETDCFFRRFSWLVQGLRFHNHCRFFHELKAQQRIFGTYGDWGTGKDVRTWRKWLDWNLHTPPGLGPKSRLEQNRKKAGFGLIMCSDPISY